MTVQITLSYPFLVSRYLMVAGLDMETRHKWLDEAIAYLLFATINSAEFIVIERRRSPVRRYPGDTGRAPSATG